MKAKRQKNGEWVFEDGNISIIADTKRDIINYLKGFRYKLVKIGKGEIVVKKEEKNGK